MSEVNEPYITDARTAIGAVAAWRCSACGADIDVELIKQYDLQVERSGVQPGTQYGPAVHWFEGTIACPICKVRLDYADST